MKNKPTLPIRQAQGKQGKKGKLPQYVRLGRKWVKEVQKPEAWKKELHKIFKEHSDIRDNCKVVLEVQIEDLVEEAIARARKDERERMFELLDNIRPAIKLAVRKELEEDL